MNGSAKAECVPVVEWSAAVVASEQIALNRLPRPLRVRPRLEGSNLQVKWSFGDHERVPAERRVEGVDQLLISESSAVREASMIPVQTEYSRRHVDLVPQLGQAIGRS